MFAVDFDGVIADTGALKKRWVRERTGLDVPKWRCNRSELARIMPNLDYDEMLGDICATMTLFAEPINGVQLALIELSRWGPIYIVTVRDGVWLDYAQQWLDARGLSHFITRAVPQGDRPKPRIAIQLGCKVIIDDEGANLLPSISGLLAIHLRVGMPEPAGGTGTVCTSWQEAVAASLAHIHKSGQKKPMM